MEHTEASSTPSKGEVVAEATKDNHSPSVKRSPKSASQRFLSFLGRQSPGDNKHDSNNNNNNSPPLSTKSSASSTNIGSPPSSRPTRRLSSPNLLSFLTHRREENKPTLPSQSPTLARVSESKLPESTPAAENNNNNNNNNNNSDNNNNMISRITPSKSNKNGVPIYTYMEDESKSTTPDSGPVPGVVVSPPGNTTTFVPVLESITGSPAHSPFHSPEHTPHSSPKPTRPPPAVPTSSRLRSDSPLSDILIPRVTADPPSAHSVYATTHFESPSHAPPRPARGATNSPALSVTPNAKSTADDNMMRQILASPLVGVPSPAFTAPDDNLLLNLTSPTVLRRPPPRGGSGGGNSAAIFDKSSKELAELPESSFTQEASSLTRLLLSRNHLSALPSTVAYLTGLTQIDLSYNKFETLPPVDTFTKLKDLNLQGNLLLQNEAGLAGIASLVNLRKLDLSSNQIESPNPTIPVDVFYLTSLQELIIPHNLIPTLSPDIAWLSNLTVADLSHNLFTEIPPEIGSLVNLKKLNLKNNKLSLLPDELSSLVNLTELDLSRNELQQLPVTLAALYNLMTLHLSWNCLTEIPTEIFGGGEPMEAEDGQMYVQGMFALRELRLRENFLSTMPESLSNLVDLQVLDLTCNQLETLPFASLVSTTKLETLMLSGNKLQEIPDSICIFPSLEVLNVSDNLLTSLPELWRLDTLRQLSVSYNKLSTLPLPPPEESWKNLEELFAVGNSDIRELPKFGELPSLRDWYLQSCGFTEVPFLHSINSLPYLEKLDLSNNSLSSLGPEFFSLETLSRFAISHNQFESIPTQLSELRRIEYLDVSHNKLTEEPETFKLMTTTIGTEIITTGNPYTLSSHKPDSANGNSEIFHITMSDLVGRRPTMEDTFAVCPNLNGKVGLEAFAIFDGHAGSIASHFVAKYLYRILNAIIAENSSEHPLKWLELTYAKLVELFKQKLQASKVPGAKHCGTTGLILLVDSNNYYIANVGDTRAVLSRGGKAIRLSTDDKPSNPEEELRIRNLGGFVVVGSEISRVNGTLAVSRSIGDFYMHPFVTAVPHVHEFAREKDDEFIVLACDGVWDEVSDQRAVDIIMGQPDRTQAAFALRDKAYAYGSDDNISVMLLNLKEQLKQEEGQEQQEKQEEQQEPEHQEQPEHAEQEPQLKQLAQTEQVEAEKIEEPQQPEQPQETQPEQTQPEQPKQEQEPQQQEQPAQEQQQEQQEQPTQQLEPEPEQPVQQEHKGVEDQEHIQQESKQEQEPEQKQEDQQIQAPEQEPQKEQVEEQHEQPKQEEKREQEPQQQEEEPKEEQKQEEQKEEQKEAEQVQEKELEPTQEQ